MRLVTPNVALLRKTMEHIESHPQEWEQRHWICGSTACFAGHAVLIDGGESAFHHAYVIARTDDPAWHVHGGQISILRRAQHILGLTLAQAIDLFEGSNTMDDLRIKVDELIRRAEAAGDAS